MNVHEEALATITFLVDLLKEGGLSLSYREEFTEDPMETYAYSVQDIETGESGTGASLFAALTDLNAVKEINKLKEEG